MMIGTWAEHIFLSIFEGAYVSENKPAENESLKTGVCTTSHANLVFNF